MQRLIECSTHRERCSSSILTCVLLPINTDMRPTPHASKHRHPWASCARHTMHPNIPCIRHAVRQAYNNARQVFWHSLQACIWAIKARRCTMRLCHRPCSPMYPSSLFCTAPCKHRASSRAPCIEMAVRQNPFERSRARACVCVCACALARVCACVWVWVSVCVRMRVGVGGCACVCGCTRVSACGCVCVWKCVRARAVWQLGKHASWDHTGECCGLVKGAQHARCCMLQGRAALFMVRSGEQGCTVCDAQWYAKLHFLQYAVVCKAALLVMRRDASWAAARARHASHRASATPTLDSAGLFTAGCAS